VPQVTTAPARGAPRATDRIAIEVWVYARDELPEGLREELDDERQQVALSFLREARRTRLVQGRELLELAARTAVRSETTEGEGEAGDEAPGHEGGGAIR
jgi:hypothetical protein